MIKKMAHFPRIFFLIFQILFSLSSVSCGSEIIYASVTKSKNNSYVIHPSIVPSYISNGSFSNDVKNSGWSYLEVQTSDKYQDEEQAYAAGLVEGFITKDMMTMAWNNMQKGYCDQSSTGYCKRLYNFLSTNLKWMNQQILQNPNNPYWHQMKLILIQVSGMIDGYRNDIKGPSTNLDPFGFYLSQVAGDLEDLEVFLKKEDRKHVKGSGSCSALIKLLPGNRDLLVSQVTWSSFQDMLRILKNYKFMYREHKGSNIAVPNQQMTFSGYPGRVYSGDDFYVLRNGLISMETTIGNSNPNLTALINPETVLENFRSLIANRLAKDGPSWGNVFSYLNSGTYNNEWMIVNYNLFQPGDANLKEGLLYVLEQLPGVIVGGDVTNVLQKQSYWPSYNLPYYPKIYNMSGTADSAKQFGPWFTYDGSPRGQIFKRDHVKVTDMDSMMHLMRYNDFKHDPLSRCDCNPPYSGENGISARSDLNPANGTYPFGALGHRSHAGIDAKITSYPLHKKMQFMAVAGPTYDNLPPFQWSKADFEKECPHEGHPDIWKFTPVTWEWKML